MIKLVLNVQKFNNYAFFCPVSRLHLTVSNPVGYTNVVTTAILKALKNKTILDVDDVIDIETGTVKVKGEAVTKLDEETPKQEKIEPKSSEQKNENNGKTEENTTDTLETTDTVKTEDKPKRGKKTASKVDTE